MPPSAVPVAKRQDNGESVIRSKRAKRWTISVCVPLRTICYYALAIHWIFFRSHSLSFLIRSLSPPNQDQPSAGRRGKLSSLRRSLNALRCRISKRGRSKPPDQFLDKFSAASATSDTRLHQAGCVAPQAVPSDGVCSRLSVDPSLPSHYRVSMGEVWGGDAERETLSGRRWML